MYLYIISCTGTYGHDSVHIWYMTFMYQYMTSCTGTCQDVRVHDFMYHACTIVSAVQEVHNDYIKLSTCSTYQVHFKYTDSTRSVHGCVTFAFAQRLGSRLKYSSYTRSARIPHIRACPSQRYSTRASRTFTRVFIPIQRRKRKAGPTSSKQARDHG